MQKTVSITSQGQITIPAAMRRALNLEKHNKASVHLEENKIIVEPVTDILELGGIIEDKTIKGKKVDEVIKMEEEAIGDFIAEKYRKRLENE